MEILDRMLSRLRSRKKAHVLPKYPFVASMVTTAPRIGSQARWPTLSKARVSLFAVACKVAYTLSRGCMVAVSRLLVYGWCSMMTPRKMAVTTLIWAIVSWWTQTMLTHCHEAVRGRTRASLSEIKCGKSCSTIHCVAESTVVVVHTKGACGWMLHKERVTRYGWLLNSSVVIRKKSIRCYS